MVEALRGLGYSLATAVADLIDNSISADAENVWVDFAWAGRDSFIRILDDGKGMSEGALRAAMRPGSRNPLEDRDPGDLGRFGLGLKTASFSQCRRLTVESKDVGSGSALRRWDLDHVVHVDRWELLLEPAVGSEVHLGLLDELEHGTLVLWECLDRVVGDAHTKDESARSRFFQQVEDVERHLGMVFHRFLEGASPRLRIFLNGRSPKHLVTPWDPFLTEHPATWPTPPDSIPLGKARVHVQGFVLPHKDRLDEAAFARAAGPMGWSAHQGFFVYRNRRLLVPGGWLGLGVPRSWPREEHYKLARIRVDLPNTLDAAWKIDVRKSTARPPESMRPRLRDLAEEVRRHARKVFVFRGRGGPTGPTPPLDRPWRPVEVAGRLGYRINRDHPLIHHVLDASGDRRPDLDSMLRLIEETVPVQQIWLDAAERPEVHGRPFHVEGEKDLSRVMALAFRAHRSRGLTVRQARDRLFRDETFHEHAAMIESMTDEEVP